MRPEADTDAVSIVKALYSAAAARDLDGMMALTHRDIVAIEADSLPYGGEYRGKNAVRRLFELIGETFSDYTCSNFRYLADENTVAVVFRFQAVARSNGLVVDQELCEMWKVRDHEIIFCKPFYFDTYAVRDALAKNQEFDQT